MFRFTLTALAILSSALLISASAPTWSPKPWLEDLAQISQAINTQYPNREWLVSGREAPLDVWFERASKSMESGDSDADARRALERLIARFKDGHVSLDWPSTSPPREPKPNDERTTPVTMASFCANLGFNAGQVSPGTADALPNYHNIASTSVFPIGWISANTARVGVVRIGVFSPQGYPRLCEQAVVAAKIDVALPCDDVCQDKVTIEADRLLTQNLITSLSQIRQARADVLLVDLTNNGGGSQWTEAAARMVTPKRLKSAPVMVFRDEKWALQWQELAANLRQTALSASPHERAKLSDFANRASQFAEVTRPCALPNCRTLVQSGFATGLLPSGSLAQPGPTSWGKSVFSPSQYPYVEGVWSGQLIVLVDDETWSAAEQFAAVIQDNDAGIIMGVRTGGAGCGTIDGGQPIILTNSRAQLNLPNCARRAMTAPMKSMA